MQEGPVVIDLTGVTTEFPPLDPGFYGAEVEACTYGISKASNEPKFDWRFNITEPDEASGRKAFYTTSLQPQSLFSFKRVMLALGFSEAVLEGPITFDPTTVIGLPCGLVVVPDVWEGKTRGRVDRVIPFDALPAAAEQLDIGEPF